MSDESKAALYDALQGYCAEFEGGALLTKAVVVLELQVPGEDERRLTMSASDLNKTGVNVWDLRGMVETCLDNIKKL